MIRWGTLREIEAELATWAQDRLRRPPAFLATIRANGSPRVHPVTPVITASGLYVFMEPKSPKGTDIRERRVFALHNGVSDTAGTGGELFIAGHGEVTHDHEVRSTVSSAASYEPADDYILIELLLDEIRCNAYGDVTLPATSRWYAPDTR
jgi:hypothetical protein